MTDVPLVCGCGVAPDGAPGAYGCSPSCMSPAPVPDPTDRAPAEQLAELVGPETARALIHAGWDALRADTGQRPDLIPPGVADYIAAKVALGVAPILLAAGRKQAAAAIRADADDEAQRTRRGCCSHTIETWLREAARIAEGGEPNA